MLYFITGNKGKFAEVQSVLGDAVQQFDIELPEIQGIDSREIVEGKLREAGKHKIGSFIVEDTSLSIDGMKGLPGPLIKWFLGSIGAEGVAKLADVFGAPASAKSLIGYVNEVGEVSFYEGEVRGKIVAPRGSGGFGWDPIFLPDGSEKTFGEMDRDEKNQEKMSMRRMALEKLREAIK